MPTKQNKIKRDPQEHAIKTLLVSADLNPDYYHYFKTRKIDFNTFITLSAEDLIIIGITDEAERNALLKCTEMISGLNSHFTISPAFDIHETLKNTISIILLAHKDLIMMKRDLSEPHSMSEVFFGLGHKSSSASLHFLKLIDQGLHVLENEYNIMLDPPNKNKQKRCSYQMVLCVASSVFLIALIGGVLRKRFLW